MESDVLLILVVVTALAFDFTNGFHDTANAMATSIATRALPPRAAVGLSAALNFVGAFISIEVATTIAEDIVDEQLITLEMLFAGLLGAILWNLATWALSLPSSSSHALIGGVVGAALVAKGGDAVKSDGLFSEGNHPGGDRSDRGGRGWPRGDLRGLPDPKTCAPSAGGPRLPPRQLGSASLVSLAHGTNDAQKTMGVIVLALLAHGSMDAGNVTVPLWVKLSAATAIALGTYAGGWRIIRTLGKRVTGEGRVAAGVLGGVLRRRGDPGVVLLRLPFVHHARDLGRGDRLRPREAAVGGALAASPREWSRHGS